jgi:hypothetical protein
VADKPAESDDEYSDGFEELKKESKDDHLAAEKIKELED